MGSRVSKSLFVPLWRVVVSSRAIRKLWQDREDTGDMSGSEHGAPLQQPSSVTSWGGGLVLVSGPLGEKYQNFEFSPACSGSVTKGASLGWEAK